MELEEATNDQLLGELARRSETVVVAIVRRDSEASERFFLYYFGGFTAALGAVTRAQTRMIADSNERDMEEESVED